MPLPTISALPTPPNHADAPTVFNAAADALAIRYSGSAPRKRSKRCCKLFHRRSNDNAC